MHPDVFVAAAIADSSLASVRAVRDLAEGKWQPEKIVKIGIDDPQAVALALSTNVSQEVKDKIQDLSRKIAKGEIKVATKYEGPEF